MTYDRLVEIALGFPDTVESSYYDSVAVKRGKRAMFAYKEPELASMKLDWQTHDRLLQEDPQTFFKTPHYDAWPWLLVRLERLDESRAREIVEASWKDAPFPGRKLKKF